MNGKIYSENNIVMSTYVDKVDLYEIYSNIEHKTLGEIYLTKEQYKILTKAFQHRGMLHQEIALLFKGE